MDRSGDFPRGFVAIFHAVADGAQFEEGDRVEGAEMRGGHAFHGFANRVETRSQRIADVAAARALLHGDKWPSRHGFARLLKAVRMSKGSRASPSRVDARVPIGVSLQVIGQVIQKPLARLRDFPRSQTRSNSPSRIFRCASSLS